MEQGNISKIKVVISDTAPLYPPLWGGPKRIWNLYGNLRQDLFDIAYIGIDCALGRKRKYKYNIIQINFKEISCRLPVYYYFWHGMERIVFNGTSLDLFIYLWMHSGREFKYILNSQEADIVICSHPWSSLCIDKKSKQFFIYDAHNCEYLLMNGMLGRHILKRIVLNQVKRIEGDACRKSDLILACSENEKKDLINLYKVNPDKIIIVTNGTDVRDKTYSIKKENNRNKLAISRNERVIIFIGAYYKPNIDAARFIIERIATELNEFKFLLVGTIFEAFKEERIPNNVKMLGWLSEEQLDSALRASDIAINPMFDGSGINIKMLDYMSYGLPIVTTQLGARGIETFGRQPMIVSSIDRFIENIRMLNANTTLYKHLSEDGRGLVAQHYDWKMISNGLQEAIMERLR